MQSCWLFWISLFDDCALLCHILFRKKKSGDEQSTLYIYIYIPFAYRKGLEGGQVHFSCTNLLSGYGRLPWWWRAGQQPLSGRPCHHRQALQEDGADTSHLLGGISGHRHVWAEDWQHWCSGHSQMEDGTFDGTGEESSYPALHCCKLNVCTTVVLPSIYTFTFLSSLNLREQQKPAEASVKTKTFPSFVSVRNWMQISSLLSQTLKNCSLWSSMWRATCALTIASWCVNYWLPCSSWMQTLWNWMQDMILC